jgi:hypothetical protein
VSLSTRRWLRDDRNGVEDDPPVQIFIMGGGDGHRTKLGKLFRGGAWRTERARPSHVVLPVILV